MASAADHRARCTIGTRRGVAVLVVLASTLFTTTSTATPSPLSANRDRCAQPYEPMWTESVGVGVQVDGGPSYPHDPPFWSGDINQPGGPTIVGGMPPYSYATGVLTVGEGDDRSQYRAHAISAESVAVLVELEGHTYLSFQSYVSASSFKAALYYWDFDDPCRQLPDTSAAPATAVPPTDDAGSPAGPADPVSGSARYTG